MMSRRPITEPPAYGRSRAGNHRRLCAVLSVRRDRRDRAVTSESAMRGSARHLWLCRAIESLSDLRELLSSADD